MKPAEQVYRKARQGGFVDPLSGHPPRNEVELTALLCIYHQLGCIKWGDVGLLTPLGADADCTAASFIDETGHMYLEYPLFLETEEQMKCYGGMRPDILFLSQNQRCATFIENKLGAGDTHKLDKYGGQFGRYIKYLAAARVNRKCLLVLTSREFLIRSPPWYVGELRFALEKQQVNDNVKTFLLTWEDVLKAFVPPLTAA